MACFTQRNPQHVPKTKRPLVLTVSGKAGLWCRTPKPISGFSISRPRASGRDWGCRQRPHPPGT